MQNPADARWNWVGDGKNSGEYVFYKAVECKILSKNMRRIFRIGDSVLVSSGLAGPECAWAAQIVELLEPASRAMPIDDELSIVDDNTTGKNMRCTLRWLYAPSDVPPESHRGAVNIIPAPRSDGREMYFSDLVEKTGSNGLDVIEGRAYLSATEDELAHKINSKPHGFWRGDDIKLVRVYYGNASGNPGPLRNLNTGELSRLLRNPTTDIEYAEYRGRMYGPLSVVLKGIASQKSFEENTETIRRVAATQLYN
eukprot:IDg22501t1